MILLVDVHEPPMETGRNGESTEAFSRGGAGGDTTRDLLSDYWGLNITGLHAGERLKYNSVPFS